MKQTRTREDDDAVSPVIGVILMVAITVILAAVIGTFVVGLGEDPGQAPRAGVTFDYDDASDSVTVEVVDGGNVDALYIDVVGRDLADSNITNERGFNDTAEDGRAVNREPDGGDSAVIDGIDPDDEVLVIGELDNEETELSGW
ncbi:MAG: type IV pilin, partial [Halobacteriales archaeon]